MTVNENRQTIGLIGSGAVATSLGYSLRGASYQIGGIISASLRSAKELGVRLGVGHASANFEDLPQEVDVVFICVPDSAIESVGSRLAQIDQPWEGRLVAHTSGAIRSDVLSHLGKQGADVLSFHPLQSFPSNGGGPSLVRPMTGVYVGLEGSDHAVALGRTIAEAMGAIPVRVLPEQKESYHLAASVASNLFVALVAMSNELLQASGLDGEAGAEMFLPLIQGTLDNMKDVSPERALTGPIARGDTGTVRKHIAALAASAPHLLSAYTSLSTEAVRAAVRGGHVSRDVAEDVLDTLLHGLDALK